jgi:hypothetical protein
MDYDERQRRAGLGYAQSDPPERPTIPRPPDRTGSVLLALFLIGAFWLGALRFIVALVAG